MRVPLNELLYALSRALDFVEREMLGVTSNHGKRTAYVSARISRALGLSEEALFDMAGCAILHDNALTAYMLQAGPGHIGRLEHFENHCTMGEKNAQAFPFIEDCSTIILHHHENWNGSGFFKVPGKEVSSRAMALRLADGMDLRLKMGDGRATLGEEIRDHVLKQRERLYSPETVDAVLEVLDDAFVRDLSDDCIHEALLREVPAIRIDLTTDRLLKLCSMFAFIIDAKSPFTKSHTSGVAERAGALAEAYGIKGEHKDKIMVASYLHDVGKLSTPLSILEKPGSLTDEEYAIMKEHAAVSQSILGEVSGLEEINIWGSSHHEKLNGKGYPNGWGAEALPFEARMIACCDIYQALTEDRPYRKGMEHGRAMDILHAMAGRNEIDASIVAMADNVFSIA